MDGTLDGTAKALVDASGLKVNLGADNDITGTVTAELSATDNAVLDQLELNQDAQTALLTSMDADTSSLAGCVGGTELQVDVVSSALPTGAATAANQSTIIGHVDGIETVLGTIDGDTSTIAGDTTSIDSKTPALGQALAAASVPVVLTAAQESTLTPQTDALTDTELRATPVPVSGTVTANLSATDNAVLDTIDAVLDTIKTDTAAMVTDLAALEVDLAAIEVLLGTIDADTGAIKTAVEVIDNAIDGTEMQVDVISQPARDRLTDNVGVALQTDVLMNDTTALTPKFAVIDVASSGDNTLVVAVADKKIRVHSLFLVSAGTVNVRFESGAGGTALTGQMNLIANTGFVLPFNPLGWFETGVNTLLNAELSAAVSIDGSLQYTEV
jgi:hypothetical protein